MQNKLFNAKKIKKGIYKTRHKFKMQFIKQKICLLTLKWHKLWEQYQQL